MTTQNSTKSDKLIADAAAAFARVTEGLDDDTSLSISFRGLLDDVESRFNIWRTGATKAAQSGRFGRLALVSMAACQFFSTDEFLAYAWDICEGPEEWNLLNKIVTCVHQRIGRVMDEADRN